MKLNQNMDKKIYNYAYLENYSNLNNNTQKNNSNADKKVFEKEPLCTKDAVKFLLDGTLRLRVCRYCLNTTRELSELDEILEIGVDGAIHEITIKDIVSSFHPIKVSLYCYH